MNKDIGNRCWADVNKDIGSRIDVSLGFINFFLAPNKFGYYKSVKYSNRTGMRFFFLDSLFFHVSVKAVLI